MQPFLLPNTCLSCMLRNRSKAQKCRKGCYFLRLCMMIISRIIGKYIALSLFSQKIRYSLQSLRQVGLCRCGLSDSHMGTTSSPLYVTTKREFSGWRLIQSDFSFQPKAVKVPFLLHKLKMVPGHTEQGIKYIYVEISSVRAVPPDCLQSMEELITAWPASNCLQRATADAAEAGEIGDFKTQPSWPQEKLHAAADAVCLPKALHQDRAQTCVTWARTRGIPQTKPVLHASSGHRPILHSSIDRPVCYCLGFRRQFVLRNWPSLF